MYFHFQIPAQEAQRNLAGILNYFLLSDSLILVVHFPRVMLGSLGFCSFIYSCSFLVNFWGAMWILNSQIQHCLGYSLCQFGLLWLILTDISSNSKYLSLMVWMRKVHYLGANNMFGSGLSYPPVCWELTSPHSRKTSCSNGAFILFMRAPFSWLNYTPQAPTPVAIKFRIRFNIYISKVHTHSFYNSTQDWLPNIFRELYTQQTLYCLNFVLFLNGWMLFHLADQCHVR